MKFETDEGNVTITKVRLSNFDSGDTFLEFQFSNDRIITVPIELDIDYLTVVRNLVRRKHE